MRPLLLLLLVATNTFLVRLHACLWFVVSGADVTVPPFSRDCRADQ